MNVLSKEEQVKILRCLVEGNSIRSTARITNRNKNTVIKLLCKIGEACLKYQREVLIDLPCKHVQCDEIWTFCKMKDRNIPEDKKGELDYGSVWTWIAMCPDTKLLICWEVGKRGEAEAISFMDNLAPRLKYRIQLTTDGHKAYLEAVEKAFGGKVDYAVVIKTFGRRDNSYNKPQQRRYSPPRLCEIEYRRIQGKPINKHISTSCIERQNFNIRQSMRRFTRLTNGFSKKVQNLKYAIALYFMYYNFARVHKTLRVTPAMEAEVANHVWGLDEIAMLGC